MPRRPRRLPRRLLLVSTTLALLLVSAGQAGAAEIAGTAYEDVNQAQRLVMIEAQAAQPARSAHDDAREEEA